MARQGNIVKRGKYTKPTKEGNRKPYKCDKYKCFLCDSVAVQLHVHLQKVHKLDKHSDHYETVMIQSRRYNGRVVEIQWDEQFVRNTRQMRTANKVIPSTCMHSDEDQHNTPAPKTHPLSILADDLSSNTDSSDDDYPPSAVSVSVVPPSPQHGKSSSARLFAKSEGNDEEPPQEDAAHAHVIQEDQIEEEVYDQEDEDPDDPNSTEDELSPDDEHNQQIEENITWKEFYLSGNATTFQDRLLTKFCGYLQDIAGGCKKERQAIQHCQDVQRVWDSINANDDALTTLLEDGGTNIWVRWAKPLLDDKKVRFHVHLEVSQLFN